MLLSGSIKVGASFAGVLSSARHGEYCVKWSSSIFGVGRMGYVGTIAGTLGDGTSGRIMCTLGGGAHIGAGVGLNTGASTLGGGARIGGGASLSAGNIGGVGGCVAGMTALKRSASWRMARICAFHDKRNGDAGAGFSSASDSILATLATLLAEEVAGMMVLWGKIQRCVRCVLILFLSHKLYGICSAPVHCRCTNCRVRRPCYSFLRVFVNNDFTPWGRQWRGVVVECPV